MSPPAHLTGCVHQSFLVSCCALDPYTSDLSCVSVNGKSLHGGGSHFKILPSATGAQTIMTNLQAASSSEYGDLGAAAHGHAEGDRQLEYMRRFERRYDGDEGASGGQCCPMETSSGPESDDEMEVEEQRREAAITARSGATRLARGATAVGRIQQPCRHLPLWQFGD